MGIPLLNKLIRVNSKKMSVSFWLDINISELTKRLNKSKKRPLLYKKNIKDTISKMYLERKKIYNEADYKIKCSFLRPNEIVNKILKLYEKSENKI